MLSITLESENGTSTSSRITASTANYEMEMGDHFHRFHYRSSQVPKNYPLDPLLGEFIFREVVRVR